MKVHKVWPIAITATAAMCFLMITFLNSFACAFGGNTYRCDMLPKLLLLVMLSLIITVIILITRKQKKLTWLSLLPVIIIGIIGISLFLASGNAISQTKFGCTQATRYRNEQCWTNYAIEEHRFQYCNNIHNPTGVHSCYGKVAKYPGDEQWCEKISLGHAGFMTCYKNIAQYTGNAEWCGNYNRSTWHKYESQKTTAMYRCYREISNQTSQPIN